MSILAAIGGSIAAGLAQSAIEGIYNNPKNQIKRLKKAGIHPNAFFDLGDTGNIATPDLGLDASAISSAQESSQQMLFAEELHDPALESAKASAEIATSEKNIQLAKEAWLNAPAHRQYRLMTDDGSVHTTTVDQGVTNQEAMLAAGKKDTEEKADLSGIITMLEKAVAPEKLDLIKAQIANYKENTDNAAARTEAFENLKTTVEDLNLGILGDLILQFLSNTAVTK